MAGTRVIGRQDDSGDHMSDVALTDGTREKVGVDDGVTCCPDAESAEALSCLGPPATIIATVPTLRKLFSNCSLIVGRTTGRLRT